jgi:hypothetical protein
MKTIISLILASTLLACSSISEETPNCNKVLGDNWSQGVGMEVEASSNLDSNRCANIGDTWCCAL